MHFSLKIYLTSGGNNFNNFPENQLTKFRAFRDSGRDSVAIDDQRVPRGSGEIQDCGDMWPDW